MAEQQRVLTLVALIGLVTTMLVIGLIGSANAGVALLAWVGTLLGFCVVGAAGWAVAGGLGAPGATPVARVGMVAALVHLFVVVAHSAAHDALDVELGSFQGVYALAVIVVAPLVAGLLLFTRWSRSGAALLAAAMAGALLFGLYWHYVAITPDHVAHLPPGDSQGLFRATAALLVAVEALGVISGLWGLARLRRAAGAG